MILVGRLVLGMDMDDRIGIDVEGDLNLRNTSVCRRDAHKLEVSEHLVVSDKFTLTLVNLDFDGGLESPQQWRRLETSW